MGCIQTCRAECPNDGLDVQTYYDIIKLQKREYIEPGEQQWAELVANQEDCFQDKLKTDWGQYWPKEQEFDNATTAFRSDLMNHKPVWVDNWKKDWWNFMRTNHAFISIFTAPQEDEYSHRERAAVLVCCSSLFSIVALIAVTVEANQIEAGFDGLGVFAWNNLITISGAIAVSIVQLYLQCMATCACWQHDEEVRERMETWGHITMFVWMCGGAFLFVYGIIESSALHLLHKFFISFFMQAIMNIIVPTLLFTGQFHLMWKAEHKNEECTCGSKWEVCVHDYLDYKAGKPLRRQWQQKESKNDLASKIGQSIKNAAKTVVVLEKKGEDKVIKIGKKSVKKIKKTVVKKKEDGAEGPDGALVEDTAAQTGDEAVEIEVQGAEEKEDEGEGGNGEADADSKPEM